MRHSGKCSKCLTSDCDYVADGGNNIFHYSNSLVDATGLPYYNAAVLPNDKPELQTIGNNFIYRRERLIHQQDNDADYSYSTKYIEITGVNAFLSQIKLSANFWTEPSGGLFYDNNYGAGLWFSNGESGIGIHIYDNLPIGSAYLFRCDEFGEPVDEIKHSLPSGTIIGGLYNSFFQTNRTIYDSGISFRDSDKLFLTSIPVSPTGTFNPFNLDNFSYFYQKPYLTYAGGCLHPPSSYGEYASGPGSYSGVKPVFYVTEWGSGDGPYNLFFENPPVSSYQSTTLLNNLTDYKLRVGFGGYGGYQVSNLCATVAQTFFGGGCGWPNALVNVMADEDHMIYKNRENIAWTKSEMRMVRFNNCDLMTDYTPNSTPVQTSGVTTISGTNIKLASATCSLDRPILGSIINSDVSFKPDSNHNLWSKSNDGTENIIIVDNEYTTNCCQTDDIGGNFSSTYGNYRANDYGGLNLSRILRLDYTESISFNGVIFQQNGTQYLGYGCNNAYGNPAWSTIYVKNYSVSCDISSFIATNPSTQPLIYLPYIESVLFSDGIGALNTLNYLNNTPITPYAKSNIFPYGIFGSICQFALQCAGFNTEALVPCFIPVFGLVEVLNLDDVVYPNENLILYINGVGIAMNYCGRFNYCTMNNSLPLVINLDAATNTQGIISSTQSVFRGVLVRNIGSPINSLDDYDFSRIEYIPIHTVTINIREVPENA